MASKEIIQQGVEKRNILTDKLRHVHIVNSTHNYQGFLTLLLLILFFNLSSVLLLYLLLDHLGTGLSSDGTGTVQH